MSEFRIVQMSSLVAIKEPTPPPGNLRLPDIYTNNTFAY